MTSGLLSERMRSGTPLSTQNLANRECTVFKRKRLAGSTARHPRAESSAIVSGRIACPSLVRSCTKSYSQTCPSLCDLKGAVDQALVVRVGALDDDAQENAGATRTAGAYRARFRPIGQVGARFYPRRAAT